MSAALKRSDLGFERRNAGFEAADQVQQSAPGFLEQLAAFSILTRWVDRSAVIAPE